MLCRHNNEHDLRSQSNLLHVGKNIGEINESQLPNGKPSNTILQYAEDIVRETSTEIKTRNEYPYKEMTLRPLFQNIVFQFRNPLCSPRRRTNDVVFRKTFQFPEREEHFLQQC